MARGRQLSLARNVGELAGGWWNQTQNPAPERSLSRDVVQSVAIGVAVIVPLALWLRRWSRGTTATAPSQTTSGVDEDVPGVRRMRY